MLEIFTSNGYSAAAALHMKGSLAPPPLGDVLNAQISAALSYDDAFLGRTWTAVISDDRPYKNFLGGTEVRQTQTTSERFVTSSISTVQTGWHLDVQILDNRFSGSIYQDATDDINYRIECSAPRPGLYLVHASDISARSLKLGFPSSMAKSGHLKRYIWVRYLPLGALQQVPPLVGSNEPSHVTSPFAPPAAKASR